jgi:hypothetical protein
MVKFNQIIRPGDSGRDVQAVKSGMRRMHVPGSGALGKTKFAGARFVQCLKVVQRHHGLKADGIYGKSTHKIIAPHFSAWDRLRYRTAKKRHHEHPPAPGGTAAANAKKLLQFHTQGKYRSDNPGDLPQIRATAEGKAVWSAMGRYVHIDARVMEALVWLIEDGFTIGTYAICSDHHYDGPHGHSGGLAVDISSVNGVSVASGMAQHQVLKLMETLHNHMPTHLKPWQLICDGYGMQHHAEISDLTIPSAAFYGGVTMSEHRNHVHLGYL